MVERLKRRYPQHVILCKMDKLSYQKAEADIELSDERLKKLDFITAPELLQLVDEIKRRKRAGYQEALIHKMVDELLVVKDEK